MSWNWNRNKHRGDYDWESKKERYRRPYNYGGYKSPDFKQREQRWKRSTLSKLGPEDYHEDHTLPREEVDKRLIDRGEIPRRPRCNFNVHIMRETEYEDLCKEIMDMHFVAVKYPLDDPHYNGRMMGKAKARNTIIRKVKETEKAYAERFKRETGKEIVTPLYFWTKQKIHI